MWRWVILVVFLFSDRFPSFCFYLFFLFFIFEPSSLVGGVGGWAAAGRAVGGGRAGEGTGWTDGECLVFVCVVRDSNTLPGSSLWHSLRLGACKAEGASPLLPTDKTYVRIPTRFVSVEGRGGGVT